MSRLDGLAETALITELRALRSELDALKNRQYFGGYSIDSHTIYSDAVEVTLSSGATAKWLVTFTPDSGKRIMAMASISWEWVTTAGTFPPSTLIVPDNTNVTEDADAVWHAELNNADGSSRTFSVLFIVLANGNGTVGVTSL